MNMNMRFGDLKRYIVDSLVTISVCNETESGPTIMITQPIKAADIQNISTYDDNIVRCITTLRLDQIGGEYINVVLLDKKKEDN